MPRFALVLFRLLRPTHKAMIPRFIHRVSPPAKSSALDLRSWGKFIGYLHTFLYGGCVLYNIRETVFRSRCALPIPYYGCVILLIALLLMVASSASVILGIKGDSEDELVPWILFTLLAIVACTVLLFFTTDSQTVAVGTILSTSALSWYPIVRIYQQIRDGDTPPEEHNSNITNPVHCYPISATRYSNAASPAGTVRNSLTDLDADPPSYHVLLDIDGRRQSLVRPFSNPPSYDVIQEVPGANAL